MAGRSTAWQFFYRHELLQKYDYYWRIECVVSKMVRYPV
jgi:hypothetical protein